MRLRMRGTDDDGREDGIALILVLGVTAVIGALLIAAITYSIGSMKKSSKDQHWNAALAAAYAGIEEYESRLANDTGYFTYGNPAATFSTGSSLILPTGAAANPAFGLGAGGSWATVAGSAGASQFRYEVNSAKFYSDGSLRLRSTGKVGKETRTITADLKQLGFIDFLYFTDFEVMDPKALDPASVLNCAKHEYDAGGRAGCSPIYFGGVDTIKGPMHSNDTIQTNGGASFQGKVTTSYKAATGPNIKSTGTAPSFLYPGDPQYVASIGMPATNSELKKETRADLPAVVPVPGCLYTGPTSITFTSDGKMTVVSPWTKHTNTTGPTDTGFLDPARCGTPGATGLAKVTSGKYVGQTFAVPANTVIYVQNVPTTTTNVNYTASTTTPPYPATGAVTCASSGNSIGFPTTSEAVPFAGAYGCRNGDVFVQGTVKGNITVASENFIYATDDIKYADAARDMLGLVGNNAVWVWNPVKSSGANLLTGSNRTIDAAVLSVAHTFMVQNYDKGSARGTLTVHGAIAQKYRGPVGTSSGGTMSTGYAKDYNYDERFRYTAPPKFLSPVTTTYGVNVWVETRPAFDAGGTYR